MQEFCSAALDPKTKKVNYREFVHFLSVDDLFWSGSGFLPGRINADLSPFSWAIFLIKNSFCVFFKDNRMEFSPDVIESVADMLGTKLKTACEDEESHAAEEDKDDSDSPIRDTPKTTQTNFLIRHGAESDVLKA